MWQMWQNILGFKDYNQTVLIENYNKILKLYLKKFPSDANKYSFLDIQGICSGYGTEWTRVNLLSSEQENIEFLNSITSITRLTEREINNIDYSKSNNGLIKKLDFGKKLKNLHDGDGLAKNSESKLFRVMMKAEWLYSTPLITPSENLNKILTRIIKPYFVFRFFSRRHVIPAITELDQIRIFDPNESSGEKRFSIKDISGIILYLNQRFALLDKQQLESISVFIRNWWDDPTLAPKSYLDVITLIRGMQIADNKNVPGIQEILSDIENNAKQNHYLNAISVKLSEARASLSEFETAIMPPKDSLLKTSNMLNEIKAIIDGIIESQLSIQLKNINNLKQYSGLLNYSIVGLNKYASDIHYDLPRLMLGVNLLSKKLLSSGDNNIINILIKIKDYTESYSQGDISLEEIIFYLEQHLISLKTYLKKDFPGDYLLDHLKFLKDNANFIKDKQYILKLITMEQYQFEDKRGNFFPAIELGDSSTLTEILRLSCGHEKKFKIDINRFVLGFFPLQVAVIINRADIVDLLISQKADACQLDANGNSLLVCEPAILNPDIAVSLLKGGATKDINYTAYKDQKSFITRIKENYCKLETDHATASARVIISYLFNYHSQVLSLSDKEPFILEAFKKNDEAILQLASNFIDSYSNIPEVLYTIFVKNIILNYQSKNDIALNFFAQLIQLRFDKLPPNEQQNLKSVAVNNNRFELKNILDNFSQNSAQLKVGVFKQITSQDEAQNNASLENLLERVESRI